LKYKIFLQFFIKIKNYVSFLFFNKNLFILYFFFRFLYFYFYKKITCPMKLAMLTCCKGAAEVNMSEDGSWAEEVMKNAGLRTSSGRAKEIAAETNRIHSGVKRVAATHFGFYDEPIQFLAALEELAEDDQ
jgi:hypothetical protein